jgi:iron complex outermembrane recepter protein
MKQILALLMLCIMYVQAVSQTYQITGRVVDENQQPLAGATIIVNQGLAASISDRNGFFAITIPEPDSIWIEVSFLGYAGRKLLFDPAMMHDDFLISLEPKADVLPEVVIEDDYLMRIKREESQTIEVADREFIARNLAGSLMKSLESLPGVSSIEIGSGQSKPLLRGLSANRVVVVEHGIKHQAQQWGADHGLEIDQHAVERVEVIKGPASLMYGSDAIGGVVDINGNSIPEKNTFGSNLNLIAKSSNKLLGASAFVSGRKNDVFFSLRFTGIEYADYRVPADSVNIYSYRVPLHDQRLRNTAGNEMNVHFSAGIVKPRFNSRFFVSRMASEAGFFANAHGLEPRRVDHEAYDKSDRDIMYPRHSVSHIKVVNRSVYQNGKLSSELVFGYQNNFRQELNHYVNHGYMPAEFPDSLGFDHDLEREFRLDVFSMNLRNSFKTGNVHSIVLGVNAEHQQNDISGYAFIIPAFEQLSSGIYVYDKIALNSRWLLHAGLRYDFGQVRTRAYQDWFATPDTLCCGNSPVFVQRAGKLQRDFHSLSWALGVNYNRESFTVKANIGKSFRMPIAKELAANGVNYHHFSYERGDANLDAEESYQFDLSAEWQMQGWSFTLSPFVNYFPNYIYLSPSYRFDFLYGAGNQVFNYVQNEVLRAGGELSIDYKIIDDLSLGMAAEYLYGEQLSGNMKGFTLPFSPPPSVLFSLDYEPEFRGLFRKPYLGMDFRMVSKQNRIVPPEQQTPSYTLLNLSLGGSLQWEEQEVNISIQVQNLLNTKYLNHTSYYRLIEAPEVGRNIVVSVQFPLFRPGGNSIHDSQSN